MLRHYCLLLLLFFFGKTVFAADIPVTPATYISALSSANNGDVLLLAPGTYATAFGIQNNKTLTLKADGTGTVMITPQLLASAGNTGGGLIFDGVTIDRISGSSGSYFINGDIGKVDILAFRNCTIQNVGRCLVLTTSANIMTNLEITNCLVQNCGGGGWALLRIAHNISNFTIKNTTFNNYQGEDIFLSISAAKNTANTNFDFENNTVYKSIKAGNYAVCRPNNLFSDASSYTFRNNIFNQNSATGAAPYLLTGVAEGITLTAEKNLIVNFIGANTTAYNIKNVTNAPNTDVTLASLGLSSIGFAAPDNGDFSILSSSPIATAGTTGGVLGDPRWLKVITSAVNLTTSLSDNAAGSVTPSSGVYNAGDNVSLTATANFGYSFKEWQDANTGNVLSTNNPYNFTINNDANIKAVFNTLTTYSFTVNTQGSNWGTVNLSPAPVNGRYVAGTEVTMSAAPNPFVTFSYWDDNSTSAQRTVVVNSDVTYTATFDEIPFIVGWDFKNQTPTSSRPGDYYSETTNTGMISLYAANNTSASWLASSATSSPSYPAARLWTPVADFNAGNLRYLKAQFSTVGYKNIQIKSMVSGSYQGYSVYKMQYSLDDVTYTDVPNANANISNGAGGYKSTWTDLNGTLPTDAEGQPKVYVRWVADQTSAKLDANTTNPGSDVEGTAYTNVFVYADKEIVNDNEPPVLVSIVPANNSNTATINGSIVLTFNERVKAGTGNITLDAASLSGVYGTKSATFAYQKLNYNTTYTFTVPAGAITDMSGNPYAGITLTFTTANRTEPAKKLFDAVVAKDGSGDYTSVIDAIAAAPTNSAKPWLIYIKNGKYSGHHDIPVNKPFIHLIGQNRDNVIISDQLLSGGDNALPVNLGSTMVVNSSDCYFEDLTIENSFGYQQLSGPQALALFSNNDHFTLSNVFLRSYQDTYLTSTRNVFDRHYIKNSRIEGAVDFIYGAGDVFFDKDSIVMNRDNGGFIVAPSHPAATLYGYVFSNCYLMKDKVSSVVTYLGRPWHESPKTVFINARLFDGVSIYPQGWLNQFGAIPAVFADYNTMDVNGNPIDLSQRISNYQYTVTNTNGSTSLVQGTAKNSLTDAEAASYSYENVVLRSGDTWDPRLMCEAPGQPTDLTITGNKLTWDNTDYTRLYIIIKNDSVIGFSLTNEFIDASVQNTSGAGIQAFAATNTATNNIYKVQSVGEFGALSPLSQAASTLPVTGLQLKATKVTHAVKLDWSTVTEINTSHFIVERSAGGKVFEALGTVKAAGNSNAKQSYSFVDNTPLAGENIYRIKSVDLDGAFNYSNLVSINFENKDALIVYPNPATSYIILSPINGNSHVNIYDIKGRKVSELTNVQANQKIDVSRLSAGIYLVEVINGNTKSGIRFIKK